MAIDQAQHGEFRYEPSEPSRFQSMAMQAAGRLLDSTNAEGGRPTETAILHDLVTSVGGYTLHAPEVPSYSHTDFDTQLMSYRTDETTRSASEAPGPASSLDRSEREGTLSMGRAVSMTLSKERQAGARAKTFKGRAARFLIGLATEDATAVAAA